MYYEEGSNGNCNESLNCSKGWGWPKSHSSSVGKWGYDGKCDVPLRTLNNFIENIKPDIWLYGLAGAYCLI